MDPDVSQMDPGSTKKLQRIIRNHLNNDLPLLPELPQVAPKTPHDHQKMKNEVNKYSKHVKMCCQKTFALLENRQDWDRKIPKIRLINS